MGNSKLFFSFFLFFIKISSSMNSNHKCPDEQRDALLVFKQNISSTSPINIDWKTSVDCCEWDGITCNNFTGDVISVNLGYGMLQGVSELDILLSCLPKLEAIDLSNSGLSVVTRNDAHYVNLDLYELRLASCNLTVFPDFLHAMKNLQILDLSRNYISGDLPTWAGEIGGNNLTYLDLSDNLIPVFPPWICNMKHLKYLDVSNNSISGMIPRCLQNISSSIVYMNIKLNMVQGSFPPWICNMKHLKYLDVAFNRISGTVPQCLQNISSSIVYMNIKLNMVQGSFPPWICNMKYLKYLDASNNNISGMIPQCLQNISSSLLFMNINSNMIQGTFPMTICNMGNLLYLDMSVNLFHGVIPQCFGNITSSLAMINLGKNMFHGTIPQVFGYCGLEDGLILRDNNLEGEVPRSLDNCESLKIVDLGHNRLNGTFPGWLGYHHKLQVLILESNNLHGTIETPAATEFLFPSLRVFDISGNGFVGRLPEKYFECFNAIKDVDKGEKTKAVNISGLPYSIYGPMKGLHFYPVTSINILFTVIDLSSNRFEGEIPNVIGNLKSLMELNLSNNNLSGEIPHVLGSVYRLEALDLSGNQLVGEIPRSLAKLNFLSYLNLSNNHLVGHIPVGNQLQTLVDPSIYLGNPGLCGPPLPTQCEEVLSSPKVEAEGGEWINMESVMLGLGCGTLIGLVLGYVMLSTGRPKWLNAIVDKGGHTRRKKRKQVLIRKRN